MKPLRRGLPRLCLLLLPLLGSCRSEPQPTPAAPLTAAQLDRKELVLQPRQEWKAGVAARKLTILLLLDKTSIRTGDAFRYRLEMRNVGREPLPFKETAPSFIKEGSLCGANGFKFYATPPGGRERILPCKPKAPKPGSGLDLTLLPGEYLLTRSEGPESRFRRLETEFPFETVGTYRLKAVYASADGVRAVSNAVTLTVVP